MPTLLMGLLLLISVAAVPACILVIVLMLRNPPISLPKICAVLALIFGFSAMAVYCYGWFSVALGGPFPELCEDTNASGAQLTSLKQDYWPLRNACIYSDGSTVEHISTSINAFVYVPAGLAVVLTCAAAFLYRRARHIPEGTS
ncbi:hypothetical protein [Streptomyces chryseus]|uniref:Integral membrane protein n=1 Tax=Streptomyces chryseus TaxID=68186 RepID=A0ABQ3EGC2_9ACTN|nr:hypothetical protein [Streptomyces chryseus]GHB33905.1 hypothetical protein GCM10010346_66310 [Streptomyces chryseus]